MVENMNQRFLELAKQARLKFPSETALSPMEEKFAELIVKECAEISENYAGGAIPVSIACAIKERFGVEE
jgi:hypothetical protein